MNIRDFCYTNFGWLGRRLYQIFSGSEKDLDSAYMKIHPEIYMSVVGFGAILIFIAALTMRLLIFADVIPIPSLSPLNSIYLTMAVILSPFFVVFLGLVIPKTAASNRVAGLGVEIPYASMYISTMTSGGLSPYESVLRIRRMDLLPYMRDEVGRIEIIVKSQGLDPVNAMEQAAKAVNMKEYKELILGYASTVRTGGDTLHYLFMQTESMFKSMSTKIKALGEQMGMLMEAYTIIGILGVLGLFLIYVVGMALPTMGLGLSSGQFFLFSFVVLPVLSVVFIYLGDASQLSYPVSNWRTYKIFAYFLPIGIILGSQLILPSFNDELLLFPPIYDALLLLRDFLNLSPGTEAALGIAVTLIVLTIPGAFADSYYVGREGKILGGINNFLRDLVETRKSGLAPERCIHALSERDYGIFSKYLKSISMKLNWGYPLRKIYEEFKENMKNWLALINIYLLIDTIEVGGGSERSLETLANFAETTKRLEDEKRAVLMPLTLVPYIGAALLTGTTVLFLQFFSSMSGMGVSIAHVTLYKVLLPPLSLHSWILGLVTGKVVSGRVSAGFKHSILLTLVSILGIWAVSNIQMGSII